jgi:hypothetical protein
MNEIEVKKQLIDINTKNEVDKVKNLKRITIDYNSFAAKFFNVKQYDIATKLVILGLDTRCEDDSINDKLNQLLGQIIYARRAENQNNGIGKIINYY